MGGEVVLTVKDVDDAVGGGVFRWSVVHMGVPRGVSMVVVDTGV